MAGARKAIDYVQGKIGGKYEKINGCNGNKYQKG